MAHEDWHTMKRYYKGDCSPEDVSLVPKAFLTTRGRAIFAELLRVLDLKTWAPQPIDGAAAFSEFERRIANRKKPARPKNRLHFLWAVATVALACAISVTRWATTHTGASVELASQTYTTTLGQQARVALFDGTQVILGPGTTLTVHRDHGSGEVNVAMTGHTLFIVKPQSQAPFTVRTKRSVTRVLGTIFSVRDYKDEVSTHVFVAQGRVSIASAFGSVPSRVVLSQNMLGIVDDSGHVHTNDDVVTDDYVSWTKGRLVFRKTLVRDVVSELSRTYGANIVVTDSTLARHTVTWTVVSTRVKLHDALDALTAALNAHIVLSNKTLLLTPGKVAPPRRHGPHLTNPLDTQYGR